MKIALYGKRTTELKKYKENLEIGFKQMGQDVDIDYYQEKIVLEKKILNYDVVILSEILLEKLEEQMERREQKSIIFDTRKVIEKCYVDDILYIEADLKRVHVWKKHGEMILPMSISKVEQLLNMQGFIKTHRSYIVNTSHIISIHSDAVILDNDIRVPISKYRIKNVRAQYMDIMNKKFTK